METSVIMAFAALSLALIAVPGPDWAYIIAAGVRGRVVGPAVGGLMLGYVVITVVVVLGLGPIAANAPLLLVALTIGGAGYLIYLGVKTLRSTAQVETGTVAAVPTGGSWGYILRGAAVSGLNPKGVLFFFIFVAHVLPFVCFRLLFKRDVSENLFRTSELYSSTVLRSPHPRGAQPDLTARRGRPHAVLAVQRVHLRGQRGLERALRHRNAGQSLLWLKALERRTSRAARNSRLFRDDRRRRVHARLRCVLPGRRRRLIQSHAARQQPLYHRRLVRARGPHARGVRMAGSRGGPVW